MREPHSQKPKRESVVTECAPRTLNLQSACVIVQNEVYNVMYRCSNVLSANVSGATGINSPPKAKCLSANTSTTLLKSKAK